MEEEAEHQKTHRQHMVPQHIEAFQFKLVGPFTLKQFGFFAVFGFLAWLIFASKLFLLIKLPIAAVLLSLGAIFAFVPIEGRSFDKMLLNFLKVITSPTQRVWIKKGTLPRFFEPEFGKPKEEVPTLRTKTSRKILTEYLSQFGPKQTLADLAEGAFLSRLNFDVELPAKVAIGAKEAARVPLEAEAETLRGITVEERRPVKEAVVPIASTVNFAEVPVITLPTPLLGPQVVTPIGQVKVRRLKSIPSSLTEPDIKIAGEKKFELSPQLKTILGLKTETGKIETKIEDKVKEHQKPKKLIAKRKKNGAEKFNEEESVQTKVVPPPPNPTPTQPNLISGIVKDEKEHLLEGVILIVKNENGAPVRALKTNLLGQFLISTPLPDGHYTISAEKEGYKFSIIEFEAKGKIIEPFEIIARK